MKPITKIIGSAISGLALATTVMQASVVIENGSFDTGVPSNGSGGSWTSSHIDSIGGWTDIGGTHGGIFRLNEAGDVNSDPTISQTVTGLTVGTAYIVSGEYSTWYIGYAGVNGFAAGHGNEVSYQGAPTSMGSWHGEPANWMPFSFTFVATGTSETIWFSAEHGGTDNDFAIDNLSLAAVPEPTTILAGLSALGMLGLRACRQRR